MKILTSKKKFLVTIHGMTSIVSRNMAKIILTVSRKSHHPIETLPSLQILKYDVFGFDRVTLENEIVWGKEETKMLNSANCRWEFSEECLADAWILQRNWSPVHYPHLSPLPFHYPHLSPLPFPKEISTIDYYWKSSCSLRLLPYFSHWISAFKCKTSDVVIFEQIIRSTPSELMTS